MKYFCFFVFLAGGIGSFLLSNLFRKEQQESKLHQYVIDSESIVDSVRKRFNTALIPSVLSNVMGIYDVSREDFVTLSTVSSLRDDIGITVYSIAVQSHERQSFEHETNTSIVNGDFEVIPYNYTKTMWPIIYEYFPVDFPISLIGLDLYGEPILDNIDEMIRTGSLVISNPIIFVDTGELGLLVLQPIRDVNGDINSFLARGLRSRLILNDDSVKNFVEKYDSRFSMYIRINDKNSLFFDYHDSSDPYDLNEMCHIVKLSDISDVNVCISDPHFETSTTFVVILVAGILSSITLALILKIFMDFYREEESLIKNSKIVSEVSHQILTPMNGIVGKTEMLQVSDISPACKSHVDDIMSFTNKLIDIIDDVVDISKLSFKSMRLEPRQMVIHDVFRNAVEDVVVGKSPIRTRVTLSMKTRVGVYSSPVYGDKKFISKVIGHLVNNSLKFTDFGKIEIVLGPYTGTLLCKNRCGVTVYVADTGVGMSNESIKRIFESFTQVHPNRITGGIGLGLPITRKLVHLMGGKLRCKSKIDAGTVFSFDILFKKHRGFVERFSDHETVDSFVEVIPTNSPASENEEFHVERTEVMKEFTEFPVLYLGQKPVVLVVDDNEVNRLVLCHMLSTMGIETLSSCDGLQAVETCKTKSFSMIFMDIVMPNMDGLDATKLIRSDSLNIRTIIVFLSATVKPGIEKTCTEIGGNEFIRKPITRTLLENTIFKYMDRVVANE